MRRHEQRRAARAGARAQRPRRALRAGHRRARAGADLGLPRRAGDRASPTARCTAGSAAAAPRTSSSPRRKARSPAASPSSCASATIDLQPEDDVEQHAMALRQQRHDRAVHPALQRAQRAVRARQHAGGRRGALPRRALRIRLAATPERGAGRAGRDPGPGRRGCARSGAAQRRRHGADDRQPAQGGAAARAHARARHRRSAARAPAGAGRSGRRRQDAGRNRAGGDRRRARVVARACRRRARVERCQARSGRRRRSARAAGRGRNPGPGPFVNPVCGMAVSIADAVHVERHEGVSYYFCCDGCWVEFRKEPDKYAAIHGTA